MHTLFEWVLKHPKSVLLFLLLLTGLAGSQMRHLKMETDLEQMLPKTLDAYVNKQVLEERFGATDMVVFGIFNDAEEGIYNPHSLALVAELTDWLQSRKEFRTLAMNDLLSLSTVKDIRGTADGLDVQQFMEEPAGDAEAIAHLKERMDAFAIYIGAIVSEDGKATLMAVKPVDERHLYPQIYDLVQAKIRELEARGGPEQFFVSGRPIIEGLFGIYMPAEMKRMQPMVMGLLLLLLFLSFRSPRGVAMPMLVVLMAEIWTLGTMAALGIPMYTVTTMLPILILAIGIADAVHFLSRERLLAHAQDYADKKERVREVMHELWKPMLMTTVTTGVGFLSMLTSEIIPIQHFGIFATVGISYALMITLLLLPATLMLLRDQPAGERKLLFSGYVAWLGESVIRHPKRILLVSGVVMLISLIGLFQLYVNASLVAQFKPNDPIRTADEMMNGHFSGTTTFDLMIDTGKADGLLDPAFLNHMASLQAEVEQHPMVGDSASIAEFLATMNKAMHSDDEAWRRVPDSSNLAAQYLLLYSFSGAPDDFDTFITGDYRQAHIRINLKSDETRNVDAILNELRGKMDQWFPEEKGFKVEWAGTAFTVYRLAQLIIEGQIASLLVSILAIFLLCWLIFRHLRIAMLAMLPVSLAVVVNYGMMGNIGIPLDIATALTGSMALGIGVDFALHYLYRYRDLSTQGEGYVESVVETNRSVGHALLFNAFVVIGGFLVLLSASLYPQMKLGGLIAATMLVCYLASVYLFPVILGLRKRIKEVT